MTDSLERMELIGLPNFPLVEPGDDLVSLIDSTLERASISLQDGDILVLAQKIVSKAEDCYAFLSDVLPSEEAQSLAEAADKDPRQVQLILDESVEVVRHKPGVIIVEHNLGYVLANAGIDRSNIQSDDENERVLLLPKDPDASAAIIRNRLRKKHNKEVSIIINDSFGRAWRNGTVGIAIGTAGIEPIHDLIGEKDLFGRPLAVTEIAVADELAAAASFLMGQASEGVPAVLIRGASLAPVNTDSKSLIRDRDQDLFR